MTWAGMPLASCIFHHPYPCSTSGQLLHQRHFFEPQWEEHVYQSHCLAGCCEWDGLYQKVFISKCMQITILWQWHTSISVSSPKHSELGRWASPLKSMHTTLKWNKALQGHSSAKRRLITFINITEISSDTPTCHKYPFTSIIHSLFHLYMILNDWDKNVLKASTVIIASFSTFYALA